MDPNETLKDMVSIARMIVARSEDPDALQLADCALSLHDWLSKGGFAPAAWKPLIEEIR